MMKIFVVFKDGKPKGLFTEKNIDDFLNRHSWFDNLKRVDVPTIEWENERINCSTIKKYL